MSPGYVATNLNGHQGTLTTEESAAGMIKTAVLINKNGPTCQFLSYTGETVEW